ncbi:MAG: hypothetical protein ACFFD8_06830 [Candidatus Thorarchaeota archaeon]
MSTMVTNENKVKRKVHLKPATIKKQAVSLPKEMLEKAEQADAQRTEPELSADQQAILFICNRGHQSFISILQGVNSTRIPIGKKPLADEELRKLLSDLENDGLLSKAELHDQPTWTATPKARDLET